MSLHPQQVDAIRRVLAEAVTELADVPHEDLTDEAAATADSITERVVAALDDPGQLRDVSGLDTHRVAVLVFAETTGVDALDAARGAELAIRQLIAGELYRGNPNTVPGVDGRTCWLRMTKGATPVRVAAVMDLGMACGNGYTWVTPTAKAFRERSM